MRGWGVRFRPAGRDDRALAWLLAGGAVSALVLAPLAPALLRGVPGCPLHAWTGLPCPGCGSTRAVLALLRGDVLGAVAWNPLAGLGLALLGVACALAPVWVAAGWPLPSLDAVLPARTRFVLVAALVLNWVYLVLRRV
jgi:hypothetical protein